MISAISFNYVVRDKYEDPTKPSLLTLPLDVIRLILNSHELNKSNIILRDVCKTFRMLVPRNELSLIEAFFFHICTGSFKVVEYMERHMSDNWKKKWGPYGVELAAKTQQFDILKFLISKKTPWRSDFKIDPGIYFDLDQSKRIACYIALSGNLDMLMWASDNGCSLDMEIFAAALEKYIELNPDWLIKGSKGVIDRHKYICLFLEVAYYYLMILFLIGPTWSNEQGINPIE